MSEYSMTIDGNSVISDQTIAVINPATEEIFAHCPDCTLDQLDTAMGAAERALSNWQKDEVYRRSLLKQCASALKACTEELAQLETLEQGMPLSQAREFTQFAVTSIHEAANIKIPFDLLQDDETLSAKIVRSPRGVVAAITPWNVPLPIAISKAAPALLTGNTVVLKPSPYTPLTTLRMGEIFRQILPPGVLNVVSGGNELGARMSGHPIVRMITFTGSVDTGKKIARAASFDLKRYVLELGGNDPAIVLNDVDPSKVAQKLFWGAFLNTGQICIAIKRLYIQESIYDKVVEKLVEIAGSVRVGDGLDPQTHLGPLNNKPQLERVIELVEDAKRAGGKIEIGGKRLPGPGYFYPPTIVTGISEGTRLVDEEQFGPVLPVMPFTRVEEAIARANATQFGLGSTVWTNDLARGEEIANQLECGVTWVNHHMIPVENASFGGRKWSGFGYMGGSLGIQEFCDSQVVINNKKKLE